jgi:hypothetical protein
VPFRVSRAMDNLSSVTLVIKYPSEYYEVRGIDMAAHKEDLYYTVIDGVIRVIYSTLRSLDLKAGDLLMTMRLGMKETAPAGLNDNLPAFSGQGEFGDYDDHVLKDVTLLYAGLNGTVSTITPVKPEIQVYPNPAYDKLYIKNAAGSEITLFDMPGKIVVKVNNALEFQEIDISNLVTGIYLIRVNHHNFMVHRIVTILK